MAYSATEARIESVTDAVSRPNHPAAGKTVGWRRRWGEKAAMVTRRFVRGARACLRRTRFVVRALCATFSLVAMACSSPGGTGTTTMTTPEAGAGGSPLIISTTHRTARPQNWSVDYWMWLPSGGDPIDGTQAAVQSLKPALMRVGGYNSDAN